MCYNLRGCALNNIIYKNIFARVNVCLGAVRTSLPASTYPIQILRSLPTMAPFATTRWPRKFKHLSAYVCSCPFPLDLTRRKGAYIYIIYPTLNSLEIDKRGMHLLFCMLVRVGQVYVSAKAEVCCTRAGQCRSRAVRDHDDSAGIACIHTVVTPFLRHKS